MSIIAGYLVPHPPLIFPEVGRGKENRIRATVDAYRAIADEIAGFAPDTVVIISPHAQLYADYFHISPGKGAEGSMKTFGIEGVRVRAEYDTDFVKVLSGICEENDFPAGTLGERERDLDHGTSIPVRFIREAFDALKERGENFVASEIVGRAEKEMPDTPKFVRIGVAGLSLADHYQLGKYIADAAEQLDRRTIVIASGDLSHKLIDEGPYGFAKEGPEFDQIIVEMTQDADFLKLFELDEDFCEKAGECGHRPLVVMAGALDQKAITAKLYSYEGPYGVGYGISSFVVTGDDASRNFAEAYLENEKGRSAERRRGESLEVALARGTVESYVKTGRLYDEPQPLPAELTDRKAGVFVSIKKHGMLRGCIGTITPVTENIGEEIRQNAVSAATRDPRFSKIEESELPYLDYSVDVLAPSEKIDSADALDPKKYGVIVTLGSHRGLLLPDLDGVDDAESQIEIAMQKAGIAKHDRAKVQLERFEVIRYR